MTTRTAAIVITFGCIAQILGYAYALPEHLGEHTWSPHAQFHHVLGWIWLTGLNVAMVYLAWGPLQEREPAAFWMLVVLFLFAHGGHWLASLAVPAGQPPKWWYNYALAAMSLVFVAGLVIAWRAVFRRQSGQPATS